MSRFISISFVDSSDLFQVQRIEDIKNIKGFFLLYEVKNE